MFFGDTVYILHRLQSRAQLTAGSTAAENVVFPLEFFVLYVLMSTGAGSARRRWIIRNTSQPETA